VGLVLAIAILVSGLVFAGCSLKNNKQADNTPSDVEENNNQTEEQNDEQNNEQAEEPFEEEVEEEPKAFNPYPDGIVRHNPEKDYLIETWGEYDDRFNKPDIEVPSDKISKLGEYALIWPEFADRVESIEYDPIDPGTGKEDRWFFRDDKYMTYIEYLEDEIERYKQKGAHKRFIEILQKDIDDYYANIEVSAKEYEGIWKKYYNTENYEFYSGWYANEGYLYIRIEGFNWGVNKYSYDNEFKQKNRLYAGIGIFKFNIDKEAEDNIIYLLSSILNRNEMRLVMMKLKELEQVINKALDERGVENIPWKDIEMDRFTKLMFEGNQVKAYVYHMYFDTGVSVSFMLEDGYLKIDACRWNDMNEIKNVAKMYVTDTGDRLSHLVARYLWKNLNINMTK